MSKVSNDDRLTCEIASRITNCLTVSGNESISYCEPSNFNFLLASVVEESVIMQVVLL